MKIKNELIIEDDGSKEWYKEGVLQRLSGPAITWSTGLVEYWINGKKSN